MIQRARQHGAHAHIGARDPTIEYLWRDRLQHMNASAVRGIRGSRAQRGLKRSVSEEHQMCVGKTRVSLRFEQLFEPTVDQRRLLDGLRSLRVPRQLFKFLYRLLVAHCHAHTGEQPVYRIPLERFDTVLAVFRRDQDAFDRGLAPR